ncbi:PAS domain S-box protein [Mariniflexile sp.]|uniref:PAS domain S-box protein n=1 Tax=Mariniflexile sp. TaxID=1979402 RepID=UPI004048B4B9
MPKNPSLVKNKLFENIFNYARGGIAIVSLDGQWIKVNKSVTNFLGYSEEELYNMSFKDMVGALAVATGIVYGPWRWFISLK